MAPENAMPAFQAAAEHGFGGIECDIWQVKNDHGHMDFMVMHDENLKRMCGINVRITKLTRRELSEYPIIKGKNISQYGGELPIPTFEEYLELVSDSGVTPVIEMKSRVPENEENALSSEAAERLTKLLYKKLPHGPVVLQSFNLHSLCRLKPFIRQGTELLYLVKKSELIKKEKQEIYKAKGISGISAKYTILSSGMINSLHKNGFKVAVWTVDSKLLAGKLAKVDRVEYVISNKALF